MLFAASVATVHCAACDKEFSRVSSSSVLFFLVLIIGGTVMTRAPFQALVG